MIYLKLNDTLVKTNCKHTAAKLEEEGFTRIPAWKEEARRLLKKTLSFVVAQGISYIIFRYVFGQEMTWPLFMIMALTVILCNSWLEDLVT